MKRLNLMIAANALMLTAGAADSVVTNLPARITADSTFYDRKEGYAVFQGHVYVNDAQYQMHAGKAFVFFSSTNDVKRIMAVGNVAMTNEMKRAYGVRAMYYKESGMVVLYGGEDMDTGVFRPAEVRDETKGEKDAQIVRGTKIRFWTNAEQVEVLDAHITAPASDKGSLKDVLPAR